MSFRIVAHCDECGERMPICGECGCCELCCECDDDDSLFDRDELGLDPEEDEYEYRRRHQ